MNNIELYNYNLPEELIASSPKEDRASSKLLCLNKKTGELSHSSFSNILELLNPNDLLVVNNSKVIKARLFGKKSTGGKVELLVERVTSDLEAICHIKANKSPKPEDILEIGDNKIKVLGRDDSGSLFKVKILDEKSTTVDNKLPHSFYSLLESHGEIPLPHYMSRKPNKKDTERYQTVYAKHEGSVAAPTAGLHFNNELISKLKQKGISIAEVTLHVGAGTFKPVQTNDITEHVMHSELLEINQTTIDKIKLTKDKGGRVIAVGTTSVRVLESVAALGSLKPFVGETDIFIYPGFEFKVVDCLITNFHLPKSSLVMLVSAFAGRDNVLNAYNKAIENNYRFYSYGDAMFIY